MNKKAIWAALAAISLVAGLQSQVLFPEEVQMAMGISLILLGGLSVFRLFSLEEKRREDYESTMASLEQERKEERRSFRMSLEEAEAKREKEGSDQQEALLGALQQAEETFRDMEEKILTGLKDTGVYAAERLRLHLTEAASRFQDTVTLQQQDTMKSVQGTLETMEERSRRFEALIGESLKASEKQFQEGHEGISSAIAAFTAKVSEFSGHTGEMLLTQSEVLGNFTTDLEAELKSFTNDLNKAMEDTLADLGKRDEGMVEEIRLLGTEYRRFEEMSQGMLDKMRSLSEEDYALLKDVFKDEIH